RTRSSHSAFSLQTRGPLKMGSQMGPESCAFLRRGRELARRQHHGRRVRQRPAALVATNLPVLVDQAERVLARTAATGPRSGLELAAIGENGRVGSPDRAAARFGPSLSAAVRAETGAAIAASEGFATAGA